MIPFLATAALPGSTVLIPLMAKLFPSAMPSTFTNLQTPVKADDDATPTPEMLNMRRQVTSAILDMLSRARASPNASEHLIQQLEHFADNPTATQLQFLELYLLDDKTVLELADHQLITKLVEDQFGLLLDDDNNRLDQERLINERVSHIRAEDLALKEQITSDISLSLEVLTNALKLRGLNEQGGIALLEAWLDTTVTRSLPVTLVAIAQLLESQAKPKTNSFF